MIELNREEREEVILSGGVAHLKRVSVLKGCNRCAVPYTNEVGRIVHEHYEDSDGVTMRREGESLRVLVCVRNCSPDIYHKIINEFN